MIMRNILFSLILIIAFSCGESKTEVTGADKYIETITGFTCEKAVVTDNGYLIIAIDAESASGYDALASQFLEEAKKEGLTRSIVGIRKAGKDHETKIFIIGNAPTALYQLKEMIEKGEIEKPALVIGVPVGFVGAAESKEEFKKLKESS